MRTCVLVVVAAALAGCGDAPSAPLASADAPAIAAKDLRADAGCVVGTSADARPTTWTVRSGDSLRRIARRVYGDENLWKAIRDANPDKVGRDGQVAAGAVLVIPYDGV